MLEEHIKDIRQGIKAGRYPNEASISQGIVLRLLQLLSWPTYDTQIVFPEYPLNGKRVDFALCHPPRKPVVFIEVKSHGQSDIGERQLFEYAFHKGVPMAILTDGQEWHFFLPAEQGDYAERRVYKLDIVEREIEETTMRLKRYLNYEDICSGSAVEAARADYKDVSKKRIIKTTLPKAFWNLVGEEDELLIELITDKVESLCGYKPDLDTVSAYLASLSHSQNNFGKAGLVKPIQIKPAFDKPKPYKGQIISTTHVDIGFNIKGEWHPAKNARDVLYQVFTNFAERDPSFLERFAGLPRHGRKRRYLAQKKEDLYPGRPDLVRDHSYEVRPGWWLGVNISKNSIGKIIKMACKVAQIDYGSELKINLGS